MAKITNRFVHFKTKASFTSRLGAGDIQESSVVFIQDANEIWTHGTYYKCDISEAEVIALINSKGYITEADIPSLTGGASATSGQYVSGVTVSGHNVTVTKAALPTNAETATKLATPRVIAIAGAISGSATFDGSSNVSINSTLNSFDASKITSGTLNADRLPEIPISKIPAAAMERLYVVESQSAAMSLTIQEGDVVQIGSGGPMYFCVSESASTFATKFKVFTVGAATSVPWSGVTNAPTKLSQFTNDSGFTTNKGTVTSVAMSVPTGLSISGSPITASGTLALSYTSGYSIPTTAKQTNWDTAYGWGNHASAGYAKTTQLANYLPLSGGTLTGGLISKYIQAFDTGKTDYNTTGKIGDTATYSTPILFSTSSAAGHWAFQFVNEDNTIFGKPGGRYVKITSTTDKSALSAEELYMGANLVATQSWVTGKGYLTSVPAQTWASITGKPTFAAVATSGSYNDLTNKPTIPSAYTLPTASSTVLGGVKIGSGINISSGVISATYSSVGAAAASHTHTTSQVTGLATVATSGSYNDLTNKPSIPSLSGYATQSWVTSQGYLTSIPAATSSAYGGIQIGYTTSGKNYAVQLSNGKAYVNVPWTDTNTTYSSGTNISISGTTINCTYSYTLPTASSSVLGGVKVGSNITVSSGTISLSKSNVTSALGYTPANTSDIPEIPVALPNPYALTINGTSYTGSSAVTINTARILSTSTLSSSTVSAGYSYNNTSSRTISSLSGFSSSNPDSVIISTAKLTFTASNAIKMDGLADLSGTYYIYCLSYMANGKIAVNGAVYA